MQADTLFDDNQTHQNTQKKRKNNPEQLRHTLILTAKDLMVKEGIANLSMQKVADHAGTSKGGLFHHFKSKEELIAAVIGLFIAQLNTAILAKINQNPKQAGIFTRSYLDVMFNDPNIGMASAWANLRQVINADGQMQAQWQDWLNQKLRQFETTDGDPKFAVIRYAVDGAWLDDLLATDETHRQRIYQHIITLF